ncbi:parthenolide synthase-like [Bidens hawaiensis]|uniref:parthenolide synthase-like n=1 Tax=Bidens hawaiensis TaxID=980011 RepID=UPI0040498902
MQIRIGSTPYLIISSPDTAKQVLKTQDHNFCNRQLVQGTKLLSYNFVDVVFSPYDNHWKEMRKILVSELMGPKRAKVSHHTLVTEMESMFRSLSSLPPNTEVNVSDMLLDLIKQKLCKVAFGKNYRKTPPKGPALEVMLDETIDLLNGSVGDSFPFLGYFIDKFSGWKRKLDDRFSNLDAYIDAIIDDHLKDNIEEISEEDRDVVHAFLEMTSGKTASGYRLSHADLKALLMNILAAGIDSTVVVFVWVRSEIVKNERVMKKLQSEIRNCAGRIEKIEELNTTKMTYLKMVVKETLRLHTPAPLLIPHESLSHTQIAGYDVFPGTGVIINDWGIARDPSNWGENAGEFYPERFENVEGHLGPDRFEMILFGGGRRSCIAMNTAPANVEFVVGNLLYWFDWELPKGMKCEDLNMENHGTIVLGKKVPLCLVPKKHKWEDI